MNGLQNWVGRVLGKMSGCKQYNVSQDSRKLMKDAICKLLVTDFLKKASH